jgi:hypothetical protein
LFSFCILLLFLWHLFPVDFHFFLPKIDFVIALGYELFFQMADKQLLDRAIPIIWPKVCHLPPEVLRPLTNTMIGRPPSEWPADVQQWLRQADANFWNRYLLPPPDNHNQ